MSWQEFVASLEKPKADMVKADNLLSLRDTLNRFDTAHLVRLIKSRQREIRLGRNTELMTKSLKTYQDAVDFIKKNKTHEKALLSIKSELSKIENDFKKQHAAMPGLSKSRISGSPYSYLMYFDLEKRKQFQEQHRLYENNYGSFKKYLPAGLFPASPVANDSHVFVVTGCNVAYAISRQDKKITWSKTWATKWILDVEIPSRPAH